MGAPSSFGKRVLFSFDNFARSWLEHGCDLKVGFFFGPKNPDFGPKIRFFVWDPVFWQSGARNPRRWFRFGTFGSSVRLFVSELRPFS